MTSSTSNVSLKDNSMSPLISSFSGSSWSPIRDAIFTVEVIPTIVLSRPTSLHSLTELKDGILDTPPPLRQPIKQKLSRSAIDHTHIVPKGKLRTHYGVVGPSYTLEGITEDDESASLQSPWAPPYRFGQPLDFISEEEEYAALSAPANGVDSLDLEPAPAFASSSIDIFARLSNAINANRNPEEILQELACLA